MKAIYPISADPIHNGHLNIINASTDMFDEVHVALGINGGKNYLFTKDERLAFAQKSILTYIQNPSRITIGTYDGLLKNYALQNGYSHIVRGVRNQQDFNFESDFAKYHEQFGLQTILMPSSEKTKNISSTAVREITKCGGFVDEYVHPMVKESLEKRLGHRYIIGVTGSMGAGKSTFCKELTDYSASHGMNVNHVDIDKIVKSIYCSDKELHKKAREQIMSQYGDDMFNSNGINKHKAAQIIFGDADKEKVWSEILRKPLMVELEEIVRKSTGIVLFDSAYIVEKDMLSLINYNVILVHCDDDMRYKRVMARDGLSKDQTLCRARIQLSQQARRERILKEQNAVKYGILFEIDTTRDVDYSKIFKSLNNLMEPK